MADYLTMTSDKKKGTALLLCLFLVVFLAMVFISCATAVATVFNPNDDLGYVEFRDNTIRTIEEVLASKDRKISHEWIRTGFTAYADRNILSSYRREVCFDDYTETVISKYREAVNAHNEEVDAYLRQRQQERLIADTKTVNGDKNWLDFQQRYCVENLYREILSRNPSMSRYAVEVFTSGIKDYQSRNPTMSQDQKDWISNLTFRIFEISLYAMAEDYDGLHRAVRARLNELLAFKKQMKIE